MVPCDNRPRNCMPATAHTRRRRAQQVLSPLLAACKRETLSEGLRPSSNQVARVLCAAQVIDELLYIIEAQLGGCWWCRRSKSSPALPNATLRMRSAATSVSGQHAHARRPIVLTGVRGCATILPDRLDAPEATRWTRAGALVAPIEYRRFLRCGCSLTLSDTLPAARELTHVQPSRRQADRASQWYTLVGLTHLRPRAKLAGKPGISDRTPSI